MRYLMVTEDMEVFRAGEIADEDREANEVGILEIIDTYPDPMMRLHDGRWHELEEWESPMTDSYDE